MILISLERRASVFDRRIGSRLVLGAAIVSLLIAAIAGLGSACAEEDLAAGFRDPPEATKPWCYWYWISDNISKDGISRDLEAMARVGIGEAFIGNVFLDDIPAGDVRVLSETWWGLIEHAIREAGRVGVNIGMFNCPGWSQSGGPWIEPEQAMRYLVWSQTRVHGPVRLAQKLPAPAEPFQDVAVVAFPAPQGDADCLASRSPQLACIPAAEQAGLAVDGRLDTSLTFPANAGTGNNRFTIDIQTGSFTARHLSLIPAESPWAADCELLAADGDGGFRTVRRFRFDRSNMSANVGPMPRGPVTIAFPAVTSERFRLVFTGVTGRAALAEIELSAAARLEASVEKQLGKMHPTPLPQWNTYLWPAQPEPGQPGFTVPLADAIDLTARVAAGGLLEWDAPPGDWIVLRIGMTTTGTRNSPASPEGQGLEVDKMNRAATQHHFEAFIGEVLRRMPADERRAFKHVVADSYEMGSQNWTDGFAETFRNRYGYDPLPWLPVLTGRIVSSTDQSDRFLWDLRRLVADRVAQDYVGGLRDMCRPHGLALWLENYGHWGFPAEFLQYGGQSDLIGGEFWTKGTLGSIECRAASSAANTYGKPFVSAEAFTSSPSQFNTTPADLKARGDWCFCEGINHLVLHVYIHQPWENRRPGVNAWFGTEFNRHNTWFEASKSWIEYLRRCCFLLQQGTRVADVAYFIGEDAPKMTGVRDPELPAGYDFDYVNAEVILDRMSVRDGRLVLPHGASYSVLVLPDLATMRPEVLRKIGDLIEAGATVVGRPPERSPSRQDYPQCDAEVKKLAAKIWGQEAAREAGQRQIGQGRVVWGEQLPVVFQRLGISPDFESQAPLRYTHRSTPAGEIYFVANPEPQEVATLATFRAGNRAPELWWPDSGKTERPAVYDQSQGLVRLPVTLGPHGSVFVVFGDRPTAEERIVAVSRDSELILDTAARPKNAKDSEVPAAAEIASNFTLALWVRPSVDTTILPEGNSGVHGLREPRNDAIYPTHGSELAGDGHAGCGLAVGRNGMSVFEHGASYFAPTLVYKAPIADWTHVAVVYRDNQPHLFLNGKLAHIGLRSTHIVHPGSVASSYGGKCGAVRSIARALKDDEVVDLVQSMQRPDAPLPAQVVQLTMDGEDAVVGQFWQTGSYSITNATGQTKTVEIAGVPNAIAVGGPWQVTFHDPDHAKNVSLDVLSDWTEHTDDSIRHFSGKATYRTVFTIPETTPGKQLRLELGDVRGLATVRLNGRELGTLWTEPWQVDVTAAVERGENTLEIDVVNSWQNRLVGDAKLPQEMRSTFLMRQTVTGTLALQPSGLLGPVTVRAAMTMDLRQP